MTFLLKNHAPEIHTIKISLMDSCSSARKHHVLCSTSSWKCCTSSDSWNEMIECKIIWYMLTRGEKQHIPYVLICWTDTYVEPAHEPTYSRELDVLGIKVLLDWTHYRETVTSINWIFWKKTLPPKFIATDLHQKFSQKFTYCRIHPDSVKSITRSTFL